MPPVRHSISRLFHRGSFAAALPLACLVLLSADVIAGEKRCKGNKQLYAGKCRYPDEIAKMRAADRRRRQAAEEARRKAAEDKEAKEEEERRGRDAKDCVAARQTGTVEAWQGYLSGYPGGMCEAEAVGAIKQLESEPPPPEPAPEPKSEPLPPTEPEPEPVAASSGVSPLVWIGFGLAAAGAVTWGVAGGISLSRTSELEDTCPNNTCSPEHEEDLDGANVAAHVTTVGVVVTAVGAALGVTGLLLPLASEDEATSAWVRLRPVVGLGTVGLTGTF